MRRAEGRWWKDPHERGCKEGGFFPSDAATSAQKVESLGEPIAGGSSSDKGSRLCGKFYEKR